MENALPRLGNVYARWDGLAQVVAWRYAQRTATITVYVDLLLAKKYGRL